MTYLFLSSIHFADVSLKGAHLCRQSITVVQILTKIFDVSVLRHLLEVLRSYFTRVVPVLRAVTFKDDEVPFDLPFYLNSVVKPPIRFDLVCRFDETHKGDGFPLQQLQGKHFDKRYTKIYERIKWLNVTLDLTNRRRWTFILSEIYHGQAYL